MRINFPDASLPSSHLQTSSSRRSATHIHTSGRTSCTDHVELQGLRRCLRGNRVRRGVRVLVHALCGKGEAESSERRADVLAPEPRRTTWRRPQPRRPEQPRGVRWRASAARPAAGIRTNLLSTPASATAAQFHRHGSSRAVALPASLRISTRSLGRSEAVFTQRFSWRRHARSTRTIVEVRTARAMLK